MVLDQNIQARIRSSSDEKLLAILDTPADYLPEAVAFANEIAKERGGASEVRCRVLKAAEEKRHEVVRVEAEKEQRREHMRKAAAQQRQENQKKSAVKHAAKQFIVGCPSCHKAMSLAIDKVEGPHQCPKCGRAFKTGSKKEIEKIRQEAPRHRWSIVKKNREKLDLQDLDAIAKAMIDGKIEPSDVAVTAPLLPAVSVRVLAGAQKKLRRLYDPLGVFTDFWSWVLVVILPAVCLAIFGLTMMPPCPAIGLVWFAVIIAILLCAAGFTLVMMIAAIPIVGGIIAGIILIATVGVALGTSLTALGAFLALTVVGGGGVWLLKILHKITRPLARVIGRTVGVEKERISNWQQWMEPVQSEGDAL